MAKVKDIIKVIEDIAPVEFEYKDDYDNIGFLFGDRAAEVNKVLVALDATLTVIEEAIAKNAGLIVTHHPFIFYPINRINTDDILGRKILLAAKNGINIYSAHTNLDFVSGGINDFAALGLGLKDIVPMEGYISKTEGFGRIGELPSAVTAGEYKKTAEEFFKDPHVRVIGDLNKKIKRIAVINGGGGGDLKYVDMAIAGNADCLVTADVRHHVAVYAVDNGLTIIEPQHYNMEAVYLGSLTDKLQKGLNKAGLSVAVLRSVNETNPRI